MVLTWCELSVLVICASMGLPWLVACVPDWHFSLMIYHIFLSALRMCVIPGADSLLHVGSCCMDAKSLLRHSSCFWKDMRPVVSRGMPLRFSAMSRRCTVSTFPVGVVSFLTFSPVMVFQRVWLFFAFDPVFLMLRACCSRFRVVKSSGPRYYPCVLSFFRCRRTSPMPWLGSHCSSSISGVVGLIFCLNDSLFCWRL